MFEPIRLFSHFPLLFLFLDPGTNATQNTPENSQKVGSGFKNPNDPGTVKERVGNCYNVRGAKKGSNFRIRDTCTTKDNKQVVDLCENSPRTLFAGEWNESTNLASLVPYTDVVSNVTYRNIYCAMCNDDLIPNLFGGGENLSSNEFDDEEGEDSKFHSKFQNSPPSMWDMRIRADGKLKK